MIEARLFAYQLLEELRRDLPFVDFAAAAAPRREVEACVVARQGGVAAGLEEAVEFLKLLGFWVTHVLPDGSSFAAGSRLLCFRGEAPEVLKVERTLLNLIAHASGVATYTRRLVERARAANPRVVVAATRKTLPFLRYIEKKAVWLGGGDPHRYSLSDAVMFKDNHKALAPLEALMSARRPFIQRVEVEVSSAEEAVRAAELGADVVMLDNVSPDEARRAHEELAKRGLRERVVLEVSGGINEENIALYAPYVDVISVGRLTHSAPALDISLEFVNAKTPVGLIGVGRLGGAILEMAKGDDEIEIAAVYDVDRERCVRAAGDRCVFTVDELIARSEFVVEAASAEVLLQYACKILSAGRHLVAASVGAALKLPRCGPGVLFIPSGAVGGLDVVAAAGGRVTHRVHKHGLGADRGPAGEMFEKYPRNLNSSVALSLAAGSEVYVEIDGEAPPGVNIHEIAVEHRWGRAYVRLENKAEGPTSALAAASIYTTLKSAVRLLKGRGAVVVGTFKVL